MSDADARRPAADPAGRRPSLVLPTRGLARVPTLAALLDDHALVSRPQADSAAVLAWGRKPSADRAEAVAARAGLPLWRVEDAFLRSLAPGAAGGPLGLLVDDLGVYYDASAPSRLETCILAEAPEGAPARAAALQAAWCAGRVSKYNQARERPPPVAGGHVLLVDQTAGDASIRCGLAGPASFARMLEAALDEHPGRPLLLKLHPEVVSGRKRGHFEAGLTPGQAARVHLVTADVHAPALLEAAEAVYTVTSQMGFEGLLWGKPVRTFGMPFYAGWGLTQDELAAPARRAPRPLHRLLHAALVELARYVDPETGMRCPPERLLDWLALQRRMRERFAPELHAIGFSRWKKPIVRAFLGGSTVRFAGPRAPLPAGGTVAVWGRRPLPARGGPPGRVLRLEDGFLRSVGLGADLVRPLSWVVDELGLYYDATQPSALEKLLAGQVFDEALRERARRLRERIVGMGLTKYNVGAGAWQRPPGARQVVLVPGQVESDASLAWGAPGLRSNLALLRAAREAAPGAHLVYKPHPDVVARLRRPGADEHLAASFCDEVVVDCPMHRLLDAVDEVHVLTSLAGFEALLRGRKVVTHGQPFYAGWGLTEDRLPPARRGRRLSLDELVAGALILYPSYVSLTTGCFTTPERILDELQAWRSQGAARMPWWRRGLRALLRLLKRA